MGSITTGIGLVSGINSADIIDKLIALERRPIDTLKGRIQQTAQVQLVFTELSTRLAALRTSGTNLRRPTTFQQVAATSSDESALTAGARANTPEGSYSFRVARLVQSQQLVSGGYATADATPVGAGTLTLELGDARLETEPALDELNGGAGVRRGVVEITDRQGRLAQVDLSDAITLQDVADRINRAAEIGVTAGVENSRLVLRSQGGGSGNFRVRDLTGNAAEDLGVLADAAADTISGKNLVYLTAEKSLASLNEGRGVAADDGDGLRVTLRDGTSFDVSLAGAMTLGDAVSRFADAAGGKAQLAIDAGDPRRLVVRDFTASPDPDDPTDTVVAGLNGSSAAADLGIAGASASGTVTGRRLLATHGSVLTSSLLGGQGFGGGRIQITDAAGGSATIDLRGVQDVAELIRRVNDASGAAVTAKLNDAGNGIALVDTSNGGGSLAVADLDGGTAAETLGWAGTHESRAARGANLQRAWLTANTKAADLNAGKGIDLGKVRVTNSAGQQATIDFTSGTYNTVADVLGAFNRSLEPLGVTARINDNGDGLLLDDNAGGGAELRVEDVQGGTAKSLRLAGESITGTINGSFEVTATVKAGDTLADVVEAVNDLGFAARAQVLKAGGDAPYRLSLVGRDGGRLGAFVFDAGGTSLSMSTMSRARDAAVFVGGEGAEAPLLVTSGSNEVADVVPGLTLTLERVSPDPVTVTVRRDVTGAVEELKTFVEGFNALRESINKNSKFNEATGERGLLLGEPVVGKVERQVYGLIGRVFETGNPKYRILADLGISIGKGATLELDEERFAAAWADDAEAVQAFFADTQAGMGRVLQEAVTQITDPVEGTLTRATETLRKRTSGFEEQIGRLEVTVAAKRQRLVRQFADLETALSRLQFQQDQLGSIAPFNYAGQGKK